MCDLAKPDSFRHDWTFMRPRQAPRPRSLTQSIIELDHLDVEQVGQDRALISDLYHRLVRMHWPAFFALFGASFIAVNLLFATLYWLDPGGLAYNASDSVRGPFLRDFFFSVHTIATVGYGNVVPHDLYANAIVVVEIGLGIIMIALMSGLMFARFSRPRARILFSGIAVIGRFEGVPTLKFRAANQRNNFILEANVRVTVLRRQIEGSQTIRRFHDLELVRHSSPFFALSWLMMHKIDETSPLYGLDDVGMREEDVEIVVIMTGFDSSMAQQIHARHAYNPDMMVWDAEFADILTENERGGRVIDYSRFHQTEPLAT